MDRKLKLELDSLAVETFAADERVGEGGTVVAREQSGALSCAPRCTLPSGAITCRMSCGWTNGHQVCIEPDCSLNVC